MAAIRIITPRLSEIIAESRKLAVELLAAQDKLARELCTRFPLVVALAKLPVLARVGRDSQRGQ